MARFAGVPVGRILIFAYMLSALCAALVGLMLTGFGFQATLEMGDAFLLPSIAAAVVGGTLIAGGRGHYLGMFGGALLLTALSTLLSGLSAAGRSARHHLRECPPRGGRRAQGACSCLRRDDPWKSAKQRDELPNFLECQEATYAELKIWTPAAKSQRLRNWRSKGTAHAKEVSSGLCVGGYCHGRGCLRRASTFSAVLGADRHRIFEPGGAHEDADARRVSAEIEGIFAAALKAARNPVSLDPYHQIVLLGKRRPLYDKRLSVNKVSRLHLMSYQEYRLYRRRLAIQSDDCRASGLGGEPCRHGAGSQPANSGA